MLLSEEKIKDKLSAMRGWELVEGKVVKTYHLADFTAAVEALNKIAVLAEHLNHHPDTAIQNHNQLTFSIWTYSEGGVTEKDVKLATEIEKLMALTV